MNVYRLRTFVLAAAMALILGYVAAHQLLGISRDYSGYIDFFDWLDRVPLWHALIHRFEDGFTLVAVGAKRLQLDSIHVYALIAGIAIFVKYFALQTRAYFWLIFSTFTFYYLLRYYTLFEMTVLRATVAVSIAFYVFYTRDRYEIRLKHIAMLAVASTMHASAFIFLPVYLIKPAGRVVVVGVAIALFFSVLLVKHVVFDLAANYFPILNVYREVGSASFLPIPYMVDIAFFVFIMVNWQRNDCLMKTCALGMAVGMAIHFSTLEYAIIAARFRELLSIFYVLYVVRAVNYPRTFLKYGSILFVLLTATLHVYVMYVHDPLLT